jgi:hypothetical protein
VPQFETEISAETMHSLPLRDSMRDRARMAGGASFRATAKRFHVSAAALYCHYQHRQGQQDWRTKRGVGQAGIEHQSRTGCALARPLNTKIESFNTGQYTAQFRGNNKPHAKREKVAAKKFARVRLSQYRLAPPPGQFETLAALSAFRSLAGAFPCKAFGRPFPGRGPPMPLLRACGSLLGGSSPQDSACHRSCRPSGQSPA